MAAPGLDFVSVVRLLDDSLSHLGLESYALKVGWYNAVLPVSLRLPHPDHSLAVVVLSTPDMFEEAFLPYLEQWGGADPADPIDKCVKHTIDCAVSKCFPGLEVQVSYDYEMLPSRKPKFLAQTAAHVAGAAYYYQQEDVPDQPWGTKKKFGVCIHPRFGGWFAIRALLVFEGIQVGCEQVQPRPPDCVASREARIRLLEDFNFRWQDWSYRDAVSPVQRYSQRQKEYFSTRPALRPALLAAWGVLHQEEDLPSDPLSGHQEEDLPSAPLSGHQEEDLPSATLSGHQGEDLPSAPLSGRQEEDLPSAPLSGRQDEDLPSAPLSGHQEEDLPSAPLSGH
ncbi:hypothetical protein CRUP_027927, partial [Coryphaenoides rupestris]